MEPNTHFKNAVFRYRSIDALLDEHQELERQTVFFAPPEKLNDPMEGLRQVYWHGDRITWRNLLRHYVICLHNRYFDALLTEDSEGLPANTIKIFQTLGNLLTPHANKLCEACIAAVEADEPHAALLDYLAGAERDISIVELQKLLQMVHSVWLNQIQMVFIEHRLEPFRECPKMDTSVLVRSFRLMKELTPEIKNINHQHDVFHLISKASQNVSDSMNLLSALRISGDCVLKRQSLIFNFAPEYLSCVQKLIYPEWCVACFSARHDNAAMWSYYASNHSGCCLVFRKQHSDAGDNIRLDTPIGWGTEGIIRDVRNLPLRPVSYGGYDQKIEFFTNIGRLPLSDLVQNWFYDDQGNMSPIAEYLHQDKQEYWRQAYWENFEPPLLSKLPDWQHEEELRVVISDSLGTQSSDAGRLATYDYDTLDGIIFGMNTTLSDKVRIMRIVEQKLKSRTVPEPFKFFQARYDAQTGRIEADWLSVIKSAQGKPK